MPIFVIVESNVFVQINASFAFFERIPTLLEPQAMLNLSGHGKFCLFACVICHRLLTFAALLAFYNHVFNLLHKSVSSVKASLMLRL